MECLFCGKSSCVLDSRRTNHGVRRRRECESCGKRFTTYESVAPPEIRILKRSGRANEDFSREKLLTCIKRILRKRQLADGIAADLVQAIESELIDAGVHALPSWQLAERVLQKLQTIDPLAAYRFAANYMQEGGTLRMSEDPKAEQLILPFMAAHIPVITPSPRRRRR